MSAVLAPFPASVCLRAVLCYGAVQHPLSGDVQVCVGSLSCPRGDCLVLDTAACSTWDFQCALSLSVSTQLHCVSCVVLCEKRTDLNADDLGIMEEKSLVWEDFQH